MSLVRFTLTPGRACRIHTATRGKDVIAELGADQDELKEQDKCDPATMPPCESLHP